MFAPYALFLAAAVQPVPATPQQEQRIHSVLRTAVDQIGPANSCTFAKPRRSDFLAVIGTNEGTTVPTVTVAGQDQATSLADVVVGRGSHPIYLVLSAGDPVIWRISGETDRVRQVVLFNASKAGVIGLSAAKISFISGPNCTLDFDWDGERRVEDDVPILAMFGRRANAIGANYSMTQATLEGAVLEIAGRSELAAQDRVLILPKLSQSLPRPASNGPSSLEREFRLRFPGGVAEVDPASVAAAVPVERYEVLPQTAGALQLEKNGALVAASPADLRRWTDKAVIGGHLRATDVKHLDFDQAYRVTRPIRVPADLCGGYSLTFFVPSRDYVRGEPCHSNIYVDDGTILSGPMLHVLKRS